MTEKPLIVKLFFATDTNSYYVQIGDKCLFIVKESIVDSIKEKEGIEVVHVKSITK